MNKLKLAYLLLIVISILLLIDIYNLDFSNLKNESYWGIITSILLLFSMIINIRDIKNIEKNK